MNYALAVGTGCNTVIESAFDANQKLTSSIGIVTEM